jgi:hypothetical protein
MAIDLRSTAEMEVGTLRVANRPTAIFCHQRFHCLSLFNRDNRFILWDRHGRLASDKHNGAFSQTHAERGFWHVA